MSFLEHLEELRKRLMRSVFAIAGAFALCLGYSRNILDYLIRPIRPFLGENKPVYLDLAEPFMLYMKVAFLASLFLAAPVILYQVWAFIRPGLYPKERRYAVPFVLFATVFFVLGGAFGYGVAFPVACKFLLSVAEGFTPALRVSSLFAFESKMILGMGLVFELPTVVYFLSRLGLITAGFLWRNFKYAILIIFIVAAVITPTPDVVTQCVFAGPMILLYLIGILVAHVFGRERAPQPAADEV
ncbi:MAG TPA: twin-arginine translocase subunit TatC [Candidatus Dormibacteraeota bacterium]|jgi:sec-independent protein translocase protein TatC|nr:twin-arginine translocase subunit TatC [Candidatus Dormibacteraeota bacterium]